MKQILFCTPSALIINVCMFIFVFTSCKKQTTEIPTTGEEIATAKSGRNPNTLQVVSLRVTINDAEGYNITSDGKGDYINGTDYVQAILDQSGTFAFNTFSPPQKIKNASVNRWVVYNFNNPVDPGNTYQPSPDNSHNYHFSTGGTFYGTNPFIPLQNLGVDGNPATECIYMGNGISNNTTTWRVSFHKGLENTETSPTAFAVVTRVSPTQWTITPMGGCSPNSNVGSLRNNADDTLYGYYYLPFSFTLTKL
ncbi:MAG TPA: hypothetical protein VIU35_07615 [Chitinophagaceae bacterium]